MKPWISTSLILAGLFSSQVGGAAEIPNHLQQRLWYAVHCPETLPGFRSVARADWEAQGLRFGKTFGSVPEVEAFVRSRIEPFSNGIWRDVLWRTKVDKDFYTWIPDVSLNKDLYKPDGRHHGYFHEGCDYLPLAAQVEDRLLGAATALGSLPALDQVLALVNPEPFWFDDKFFAGEWITNGAAYAAVGRLLSDSPSLSAQEFYQASKVLRRGSFDFFDCKLAGGAFDHPVACAETYDYSESPLLIGADEKPLTSNYFLDLYVGNAPMRLGFGAATFHPNGKIASVALNNPRYPHDAPDFVRLRLSLTNPGLGRVFLDRKDAMRFFFDESGDLRAGDNLLRTPNGEIVYQSAEPQEVGYEDEDHGAFQYPLEKGMIWKDAKGKILGGQLAKSFIVHSRGYPYILCEGTFALFGPDGTLRTALGHPGDTYEACFDHENERELSFGRYERVLSEDRVSHEYLFLAGTGSDGGWLSFNGKYASETLEPLLAYKAAPDCAIRKEKLGDQVVNFRVPANCFYFVRHPVRR